MPPLLRSAARSVHVLALALLGLASTQCVASRPWLRTPSRELDVPVEGHQLAYGDARFVHARRQVLRELLGAQGDPQGFSVQIATALRYGQPSNYFSKLARSVAALTADELRTNYSSWLAADKAVMLIQGPAAGIEQATQHSGLTYVRELKPILRDDDRDEHEKPKKSEKTTE